MEKNIEYDETINSKYLVVDLIVVGDFPERHHKRAAAILDLTDLPIDPLCYTGEEFAGMVRSGNPFISRALAEGIRV